MEGEGRTRYCVIEEGRAENGHRNSNELGIEEVTAPTEREWAYHRLVLRIISLAI